MPLTPTCRCCLPVRRQRWTCWPMSTLPRRCVSLLLENYGHSNTHDHHHHDDDEVAAIVVSVTGRAPRIGVGGPVGSGKTALVAALCRALSSEFTIGVVTNDIYTTEDAEFLRRAGVLPDARIRA